MDDKKIYLTREGLGELKKEFEELSKVKRPDVLTRVSQARDLGDLSMIKMSKKIQQQKL